MASANESQSAGMGGEEDWPPGFRFHPTEEELVLYYLKRKICGKRLKLNIIAETDVYKWDPEELPGLSLIKSGDRQWFFFTPRDRKYPNGARSNRATTQGYWKATGKDRCISCNSRSVGLKKTLVFYRGRAPHGERTDWVMHEYTLDEEELKRCQNVQEYFALYKVFKKSGAGPKTGEQYGAPFREEDWNYDCPDFDTSASRDIPLEKVNEVLPNGVVEVDCQAPPFSDDIEELLKYVTEEPLPDLPAINDHSHTPSQVLSQEGVQIGTTVDLCINHEPVNVLYGNGVQRNLQVSFDHTHSTDPQVQLYEAPNAASEAPKVEEQRVYVLPGEDFLEMDDLFGPESVMDSVDVEEALNGFLVNEADGLCDLDQYHDAAIFLNDIGADHCEAVNQYDYHLNPNQLGPGSVVDQLYVETSSGLVHQPYLEVTDPVNHLYPINVNQISNQLYQDEASLSYSQEGSVLTSAEFFDEHYPGPNSGVVYGSSNTSLQVNQNQDGNEDNGANSWFSSALWSFVESIPTTPASAAENALVNRAFGRMSSFSRLRMNAVSASVTTGSDSETVKSSCSKRGFILFPVIVAVLAVSWVVLGAVNVWGTGISA